MKISYEFEGHDLAQWAEYGGLPVLAHLGQGKSAQSVPSRLVCVEITEPDYACNIHHMVGFLSDTYVYRCSLRFTDLKDIIDEAPEWAEAVVFDGQKGFWFNGDEVLEEIKGHLFNPEVYKEPINLEEVR